MKNLNNIITLKKQKLEEKGKKKWKENRTEKTNKKHSNDPIVHTNHIKI